MSQDLAQPCTGGLQPSLGTGHVDLDLGKVLLALCVPEQVQSLEDSEAGIHRLPTPAHSTVISHYITATSAPNSKILGGSESISHPPGHPQI